jgi:hypothetical protein
MNIDFGANCECCTYLQEIRGTFWMKAPGGTWQIIPHTLYNNVPMVPGTFHEDGAQPGNYAVGHYPSEASHTETWLSRCQYRGEDKPGWPDPSIPAGWAVAADLHFRGSVFDTCRNKKYLETFWDVAFNVSF